MTIPSVSLSVSGLRITARYALSGPLEDAPSRAAAIAVEQTIEFPADLISDDDIRRYVIGRVESIESTGPALAIAELSYAVETTGFELPQMLNVLFGNCSLLPGVRLIEVGFPSEFLARFRGPRFGIGGLRRLLGVPRRPLLATALKPMGLDSSTLAQMAGTLARGGIDLIKDDHSLANQPFAVFVERVAACAAAVADANSETGRRVLYLPSVNAPAGELEARVALARAAGAGGLLVLPGLAGFDEMRRLADDDAVGLPLLAHPAFLGSFVADERAGIEHGLLFGTLARLAGADMTIFPSYGGRFSFSPAACGSIAHACRESLGSLGAILPVPAGGMTLDRLAELVT
ncbi:MAG: RuBisCO large subunit C-terminal-like domain-containing protein, partial [Candidatus Limnocylindrales bacterium]